MDNPTKANTHPWGTSKHLVVTERFDVAYAEGKAGGASSMHVHDHKHNVFVCLTGIVEIRGVDEAVLAELRPRESYTAPAGLYHRMVFVTDATLYEFYCPVDDNGGGTIDLADIHRIDGGWTPDSHPRPEPPE